MASDRTKSSAPRGGRPRRARLDPLREIVLHHICEGPSKGWLHTHGLAAHGKPELEIRDVPLFLGKLACRLLNELADYMLNDATRPVVAGERIQWGRCSIQVLEARPDPDAGYDAEHYAGGVRLVLVDPPESACSCVECAKERAASRLN
jgi:hypothetical protein